MSILVKIRYWIVVLWMVTNVYAYEQTYTCLTYSYVNENREQYFFDDAEQLDMGSFVINRTKEYLFDGLETYRFVEEYDSLYAYVSSNNKLLVLVEKDQDSDGVVKLKIIKKGKQTVTIADCTYSLSHSDE